MKVLEQRDTSILVAMASDVRGKFDAGMTRLLSKQARPIAKALQRRATGTTSADRRARAIIESVESNREARRSKSS